jgi:cation transport protein ChaC
MRLTRAHVARLTRQIYDPGPQHFPERRPATDADYDTEVARILAGAPDASFWVFAYGSLIWNPDFDHEERRLAVTHGWRRSFCLGWAHRSVATRSSPG